jgi:hypothetical protein
MANWSVSSLRTDHLYVRRKIADIAQRSGPYRMKELLATGELERSDAPRHSRLGLCTL